MKKLGLILFFLGCFFTGISQQKIIIRGAGAIDTTGKFVYDVFLSNDSLFYSKGGNNVYIGKLIAVTDDSLQTVMRRSSVLTESSSIVNNTPNEPYYNITMDTAGSKVAYDNLSLKFGHELVWIGGGDSSTIVNIGTNGIQGRVIKNSGNSAELVMSNSSEDVGLRTRFNGLTQYNEATLPSGSSAPGVFHLKTETGAHYAFPRSKPTLNQILKVTDTTTYPDMQVLSWVDGIDSLKVDSVKVYSSTCVDTFKYWVSGTPTTIATVDKQNGLNSGGVVTPAATDTTFDVSAAVYKLLCTRYASAATLVTLNGNSDSSKGRIDVIGVNTSGAVFGLQGTNATNPIAPALSATQLGLATVTFPPLSDSGVVNIYNNFDYNGIDSSAYRSVTVTPDSLCFIFSSLRQSDTICSSRSIFIDSLRRLAGSVNVEARKGGVWVTQFTDSVGSGTSNAIDSLKLTNSTNGSAIDTVFARKNGTFIPQFTLNAHVDATANNKFSRVYSGVIRATTTGASQPITWAFLDSTTGHQFFGFDSVNGSGNAIRVYYPKVKNVSGFVVTPDETLAQMGVIVGSSVGDSVANIYGYLTTQNTGSLTGNGTTWSNSGLSYTGLTYTSSTGRTVFTPTTSAGTIYTSSPELEGMIIQSIGDSMRYIQRVYSALGGQTVGFRMLDSIGRVDTGALTSGHKLAIIVPRTKTVGIPAQTSNSNGFPNDIYVSTANYWILAQMDVFMIASATSGTTATIEWQTADVPTNIYATNYRITRATAAAPNTETTLFNGFGFSYLDTGLTPNTQYIYRMYATISGTERLITNEKIKTF